MLYPICELRAHTNLSVGFVCTRGIGMNYEIGVCDAFYNVFVCNKDWNITIMPIRLTHTTVETY